MNTKIILVVIFVAIVVGLIFVNKKDKGDNIAKTNMTRKDAINEPTLDVSVSDETQAMDKSGETKMMDEQVSQGRYVPYSDDAFEQSPSNKKVLFFYANWCPLCKPVDVELNSKPDEIPVDVTVFRVNYNDSDTDETEKALADQYGITYQHTFVLTDANGEKIKSWNGGGLEEIIANTNNL
jgi:thioredoxin 1